MPRYRSMGRYSWLTVFLSGHSAATLCAAPSSYGDLFAHSGSWFYHRNGRLRECLSQCRRPPDLNRGFGGNIGFFRDDIGSSFGHRASNGDSTGTPTSRFSRSQPPARSLRLFLGGHRDCLRKIKTRQLHPGVAHRVTLGLHNRTLPDQNCSRRSSFEERLAPSSRVPVSDRGGRAPIRPSASVSSASRRGSPQVP